MKLDVLNAESPCVETHKLDTLWLQVGGTICNLQCHHCFISCSPTNDKFGFMSLDVCRRYLQEAAALDVKEFYFTGGEPFANPEICDILEDALVLGSVTVLTNATLFREGSLDRLGAMLRDSANPLEVRVSLDGHCSEMNDPIRGEGTFDRAMGGIRKLVDRGARPIITITRTWSRCDELELAAFKEALERIGYAAPRLKVLPLLKLGAEVERTGGYCDEARITSEMMADFDHSRLLCSSARMVTDRGVWVCPILIDSPEARMGDSLAETVRDYPLRHAACHTCWSHGAICSNATGCEG